MKLISRNFEEIPYFTILFFKVSRLVEDVEVRAAVEVVDLEFLRY